MAGALLLPSSHAPSAASSSYLHQAVHWIARLGGLLGRRADGEPGVKTIWLGFRRLADIAIVTPFGIDNA
jgi:hypothetical protein